ncbi:nitroreductase family protein [Anaeromicropila herbilytica]|uniref:Nitroreductase n=1 Tax=Anaeromicropila herbilytica TaxID=2785025 RepID=A0A7R7EJR0_9FIRM|nr:nitroreductase family protein [Anaeromicropila herbilytica]BCN30043.1 nitroreductase [Anaeromicropila herbilytica]
MEFKECIKNRRSIRKFKTEEVSSEDIIKMVDAASLAPSWKNTQVTRYYAVKTKEIKDQMVDLVPGFNQPATSSAPVIIVSTVVKKRSGFNREGQPDTFKGDAWEMYDCGQSNLLFCLEAHELGYGTVIMGYFDAEAIHKLIGAPDTEEVSSVIALGIPEEHPDMPKRKGADLILKEI